MLLHNSCPYEKVSKQSTKKYWHSNFEERQKTNYVRDGSKPLPQCVNYFIFNHFELLSCGYEANRIVPLQLLF